MSIQGKSCPLELSEMNLAFLKLSDVNPAFLELCGSSEANVNLARERLKL